MSEEKFRIPETTYDNLTKIIQGYSHFEEPASPRQVAGIAGMHESLVSRNGAFLVGAGIVEGGRQKQLTPTARNLSRAIEFSNEFDESRYWNDLISDLDFIRKLIAAINIRKGMDRQSLHAHILYTSGASKSSPVNAGANALIEILLIAKLIEEEGDKYVVASPRREGQVENVETLEISDSEASDRPITANASSRDLSTLGANQSEIPIRVEVVVNCRPEELTNLGAQIRKLIEELSSLSVAVDLQAATTGEEGSLDDSEDPDA